MQLRAAELLACLLDRVVVPIVPHSFQPQRVGNVTQSDTAVMTLYKARIHRHSPIGDVSVRMNVIYIY